MKWPERWNQRVLVAFDHWFSSSKGVYQTLLITVAIIVAEKIWPHSDPNGFLLLYWLTVYSAVTQPALAHSNREQAEKLAEIEQNHAQTLSKLEKLEGDHYQLLSEVHRVIVLEREHNETLG